MLDGPNISSDPRSMYRILGADRKEYGPVSADDIRVWIREGRANGQTLACSEGGAWQPLSSFPEFAQALGAAPASPSPLPAPSSSAARVSNPAQLVQGPGIVLVIVGALGFALHISSLLAHVIGWTLARQPSTGNPELDRVMTFLSGGAGVAIDVLWLGLSALIGFGGLRMIKLKNYGLCIAASVIALVPCLFPCCCLGLPAGIWALIVLSRPEVKAAFESRSQ